jgi:translation initiation factor 3 subunit H
VQRNLETILDTLESHKAEESNVSYAMRQIAREKAKADAYVTKRKEENAMRVAQGLSPLPEEDVSRLFRVPPEPSRLEGMLNMGQIDGQAKTLDVAASAKLVKIYAARAGSGA